jgi:hypothetical protein
MSLRIRQIVFAARDLAAVLVQLERVLGLQIAYRDPMVKEFGLENAVLPVGDQFVEVVAPIRTNTAAGRHLDRHGDSAYMLILQTDDIARDRARLELLNVRTIWGADYPDIRATQIHPKDIGAAIVSLDEPTPREAWRWAGADWQKHVPKSGAQRIREATIGAHDSAAMARRWAAVLGTDAPIGERGSHSIQIASGALNFVPANADRIVEYELSVSSLAAALSAAHALQLPITDSTVTLCGTRLRLIER